MTTRMIAKADELECIFFNWISHTRCKNANVNIKNACKCKMMNHKHKYIIQMKASKFAKRIEDIRSTLTSESDSHKLHIFRSKHD